MQMPLRPVAPDAFTADCTDDHGAGFNTCDLLDLNGGDVAKIVHDPARADASLVTYRDSTTLSFAEIARIIPCFTAASLIATPGGECRAADLSIGDRVLTRDNGIQTITWAGQKTMTMRGLAVTPDMRPVRISKDAFGPNCPERDMVVSPNHRILMHNVNGAEVLLAAKSLTHMPGIAPLQSDCVTYIHFMCAHHEIVFSDGLWTETFQPNDDALRGIDAAQRNELFAIFPELVDRSGRQAYGTARETVSNAGMLAA